MQLKVLFILLRSRLLTRMLISTPARLRKQVLANPRIGILRVLQELNRTNSRYYAAVLTGILATLPEDILSSESLLMVLGKKLPLEFESHRQLLRTVSAAMEYGK